MHIILQAASHLILQTSMIVLITHVLTVDRVLMASTVTHATVPWDTLEIAVRQVCCVDEDKLRD